ncbi:fatty acid desaturase [Oceanibacterium hippocampi]|uniref:Fatty acid desaturase n=1 Tax=Oceanibacterium hippocampi TaxID=745714 RepID=A0A1Y5R8H7_9PROT|nr:fatty acid desaturase [Oceanibacterium hippocampi]SLN11584.1 Fatty acid desaturase [Oceanibacterium hippocampi]
MSRAPIVARPSLPDRLALPTWTVIVAIYGGWLLLVAAHSHLPIPLLVLLGGWFVCWQGSLQHETVHGHPTRWRWLNTVLAAPPLSLWMPYPVYRETHLEHHATAALTDPDRDPESAFVSDAAWRRLGPAGRAILWSNQTIVGRLLLGPWLHIIALARSEYRRARRGEAGRVATTWMIHAAAVACLLILLDRFAGMSPWVYILCFAWPGASLTALRSFAEHAPYVRQDGRTALVETFWPMRLLYLNNTYHAVHHARPGLPWYRLGDAYRAEREAYLALNGGYVVQGYAALFRHHLLTPRFHPRHALVGAAADPATVKV